MFPRNNYYYCILYTCHPHYRYRTELILHINQLTITEAVVGPLIYMALPLGFRIMTLLIAFRMVTPAFSMSFFDRPDVMQTLRAGWTNQSLVFAVIAFAYMRVLSREIITPLAND